MSWPRDLPVAQVRIARPTDQLDACVAFYRDALGLRVIDGFDGHAGYRGVMLGLPDASLHLELTSHAGGSPGPAPTSDNLLVLYLRTRAAVDATAARLAAHGHHAVEPENPYWAPIALTVEDPDGWRVVLVAGPYGATRPPALDLATIPPGPRREEWVDLLALADEPGPLRRYLHEGTLYGQRDPETNAPQAAILTVDLGAGRAELRAVAVADAHQGAGLGRQMLEQVCRHLHAGGTHTVVVGTASSGVRQLAFYQRAGFRLTHIERDYFTGDKGYPDDLAENGIPSRDMVWMDRTL